MGSLKATAALYGLTEGELIALRNALDHCPLCLKPFKPGRPPQTDHDHVTGLCRGLLCSACNRMLLEDAGWLARAADYLRHPPAPQVLGRSAYAPNSPGAAGVLPGEPNGNL